LSAIFLNHFPISVLRYGEVVDVNLVRDKTTGKSRGFAFLAYEDQRSTVLAVGEDSLRFLLKSLSCVVSSNWFFAEVLMLLRPCR
jgi:RNA recognition motif-containing protein